MDLPQKFCSEMGCLLGSEDFKAFEEALEKPQSVAFRPNGAKGWRAVAALERVPWSSLGCYLEERPAFTFDPLFHGGAYYVQEPSSMFLEQALSVAAKECGPLERCLDLCAAPGGKSTLLRSLLPEQSLLVSNEVVGQRAQILLENILKWGNPDCVVSNSEPSAFAALQDFFDAVVVDAPCSGEGMFRKDNPALQMWSPANVRKCADLQRRIVADIWPALRSGGFLIYSTCTYNLHEDEENVDFFCKELGAEVVEVPVAEDWRITGNLAAGPQPVYHFLPHKTRGEGFFLALLRKTGTGETNPTKRKSRQNPFKPLPKEAAGKLNAQTGWKTFEQEDTLFAVRYNLCDAVARLLPAVRVLSAGIPLMQRKGHKMAPHHGLAMSTELQRGSFPEVDLDREDALDYLRRMALPLPAATPRGIVLLTFRGLPLGFANNLGAHANNLYPQNWRIRSGYASNAPISVVERKA